MTERIRADICVIGAGSGGLTVAAAAASFGVRVVLVERGRMGGDCLNVGCVPSKALIAAARHAAVVREAARFGVDAGEPTIDYARVAAHVADTIAAIAPHDSVERFEGLGVTVLKETARFLDGSTIEAGGRRITARRFVIATGSAPAIPPIPGLEGPDILTNESVFDLSALPETLAVVGGGPIGAELGQAFRRLGTQVTILEQGRFLAREDRDLADVVRRRLAAEGVAIREGAAVEAARRDGGETALALSGGETVKAARVLVAAGRTPVVADLDLAVAGVDLGTDGIRVDRRMRTTNPRIFAIGDVTGGPRFTHVSGHQASLVVRQILFRLPAAFDAARMPRATYTAPELGQVGLTAAEARARHGDRASVHDVPLAANDRARTEGETDGFLRLVADGRGRIVGAGAVAPHAGELVAMLSLALAGKVRMATLASFVAPYPTYAELAKAAAVDYYKTKLTGPTLGRIVRLIQRIG